MSQFVAFGTIGAKVGAAALFAPERGARDEQADGHQARQPPSLEIGSASNDYRSMDAFMALTATLAGTAYVDASAADA